MSDNAHSVHNQKQHTSRQPTLRHDKKESAFSKLTRSAAAAYRSHKARQTTRTTQARQAALTAQTTPSPKPAQPAQAYLRYAVPAAGVLVVFLIVVLLIRGCLRNSSQSNAPSSTATTPQPLHIVEAQEATDTSEAKPAFQLLDEGRTTSSGDGRVTFAAFGDNLMNANLLELADSWAGDTGDGSYDFTPFYRDIAPLVQNEYDISFVNQETTMGGTDNFGYMGWPSYNTPDEVSDALVNTGFRLVATNSNHTYDTWVDSILHNQQVWKSHPQVLTAGSYASEADRQMPRVIECNGIRIAFLAYCYGQNGYEQSDLPNAYYSVPIDKQTIAQDVARAQLASDFVLVYMHWGEPEYVNDINSEQHELAQYCADLGVGMVIGSHVHVIQPVEWLERSGGGQMLCAYGLGDFVSGYENFPETVLSGAFTCTFVRSEEGEVGVEDPAWLPLIEHRQNNEDWVCLVRDYTSEQAEANELLSELEEPYTWVRGYTESVLGSTIPINQ